MKKVEVVAGILIKDGKVFCAQRGGDNFLSKKWEFPGGKIDEGETNKEALKRELSEELEVNITVGDFFMTVNHDYPTFTLIMHTYICFTDVTVPKLNVHLDCKWLPKEELLTLDWAEADIPIVEKLISGDLL